jgi:nitric oxide reductase NorD protein
LPDEPKDQPHSSLDAQIHEHLKSVKSPSDRKKIAGLVRELTKLPLDHTRAALETSATLAGVSLRASIEFLRAAPDVSQIVESAELRAWGELGRRLTMSDVESGVAFFTAGVGEFARVPSAVRPFVFQVCARQMILSATTAAETFREAPRLTAVVGDIEVSRTIYEVAASIARRSAKHSAEFLSATPIVIASLERAEGVGRRVKGLDTSAERATSETSREQPGLEVRNLKAKHDAEGVGRRVKGVVNDEAPSKGVGERGKGVGSDKASSSIKTYHFRADSDLTPDSDSHLPPTTNPLPPNPLTTTAIDLVKAFAESAGGIAADAWASLPMATEKLNGEESLRLMKRSMDFLERGGAAALHLLISGGEVLRTLPDCFNDWIDLLWTIAPHGNAGLVAFIRSSPTFFQNIAASNTTAEATQLAQRILLLTRDVARVDAEAALACIRVSAKALRTVSIEQFENWARAGLIVGDTRARRSYYALETRTSNEALRAGDSNGVSLESIQPLLRLYVEGLTGRAIEIAPLAAVPVEARIGDGRTIHLPSAVAEFGEEELDFRLYKVLAAHAAGQIEFGTYERDSDELRAAFTSLSDVYDPAKQDERDSFAIDPSLLTETESHAKRQRRQARGSEPPAVAGGPTQAIDYRAALTLFPIPALARRIFGTLENGRIDRRLRRQYRGLNRDLDLIRAHLRSRRPKILDLPPALVPFELLFQITMLGGALDDAREFYRQVVSELETIVAEYVHAPGATVADSLMATSRVYELFQSMAMEDSEQQIEVPDEQETEDASKLAEEMLAQRERDREPQRRDARELFNAWNSEAEGEFDELDGSESWSEGETPEQGLEEGEVAFNYDEWDRELTDHRVGWCRVIEKKVKRGNREFVDETRDRYKGVISSIRHQFQLMKPENLTKIANELDGEDYDLNAVVDFFVDRRADGQQSERIYTKRLRRRRDVAVSFLLDQSSSTARTIGRHPLQPYTHPGRRIIEIEKEGLILMSEALEAVGDVYSINGFTSEGRRNVKFYVMKDFGEHYSDEVMRRIGGITYQNNTRLGAAIRHATAKLEKQEARTRLLIVLSDGRPYDHDYGDARYAREDTREALVNAKIRGITPFCITIDRESESELRDLYGEVGYTIIDDVLSLPERLPGIYRRLTT